MYLSTVRASEVLDKCSMLRKWFLLYPSVFVTFLVAGLKHSEQKLIKKKGLF